MEFVAVDDRFGQSGSPDELMAAFGLKSRDIVTAAGRVLKRKTARVF
jgi:transketolase